MYPYLGLSHPAGRTIYDVLCKAPATRIDSGKWWRARRPEGAIALNLSDLLPPDAGKVQSEGRFNHFGQRVFYLASSPVGAALEILDVRKAELTAWVQLFHVSGNQRVMDLRRDNLMDNQLPMVLVGLLSDFLDELRPSAYSWWKPEYFVPRFIADCAREQRYEGILFGGMQHQGDNLVVFQSDGSHIKAEGSPRLRRLTAREVLRESVQYRFDENDLDEFFNYDREAEEADPRNADWEYLLWRIRLRERDLRMRFFRDEEEAKDRAAGNSKWEYLPAAGDKDWEDRLRRIHGQTWGLRRRDSSTQLELWPRSTVRIPIDELQLEEWDSDDLPF
ncbi:MAG: RES family NAD+ phosphorylase [Gemmatimonadaceae bacterium]|nr:RES family NAD+ phosphorylase [Gemmatimonadaceae bacterium]